MTITSQTPVSFAEAQDILAATLPGYTRRPQQMALGERVELAIAERKILLAQAGCGTGKSLAAAIPAILAAAADDKRTIYATATKALQDQIARKDLPFLAEHLGVPFTFAVIKGRSNYPCLAKIDELSTPTPAQAAVISEVKQAEDIVDKDALPAVTPKEWSLLSMSADECPGAKNCSFSDKCHAERAKAKAAEADLVVTNVAYLLKDLQLRQSSAGNVALLGDYDQLILDEAHNLPEQASGALETTLGEHAFSALVNTIGKYLANEDGDQTVLDGIVGGARELWRAIDRIYAAWVAKNKGKTDPMALPVQGTSSNPGIQDTLGAEFIALYQAIELAHQEVKSTRPFEERAKISKARLLRRTYNMLATLKAFTTDPAEQTVRWIEQEETEFRGRPETRRNLRSAPIEVGPFLRSVIWDVTPAILMSATLAAGTDFSYLEGQLGLGDGEAVTFDAGSPFDYTTQARLFVPDKNVVDPSPYNTQTWRAWAQATTEYLVTQAGGNALLLYTSRSGLNDAYRRLAGSFERQGLTVLKQGDMPTGAMIAKFREGGAVLFGLKTFFEGIDIPGDALRLVVLDKLPFAVPTDIKHQARCALVDKQHPVRYGPPASFSKLSVPAMTLVLTQAFGRLIRHRDDKGLVAILDSRLESKKYGAKILAALPPAPKTNDPEEAAAFLR